VNSTIQAAEAVMTKNAEILNRDLGPKDPEDAIKTFVKSSMLGRHNYISYGKNKTLPAMEKQY
jgi:hypothetical protein